MADPFPPAGDRWPSAAELREARRLLRRVVGAGAHLGFEQLEALVDDRADAAARAAAQAHLAWCAQCSRELADLQRHAPALRQRLAAPAPGWRARLGAWLGSGPLWSGVAAACGVAALALFVGRGAWLPHDDTGPAVLRTAPEAASAASAPASAVSAVPDAAALDTQALASLERVSRAAQAAWRAGDYARLVPLLRQAAEAGSAPAAAALGLLHAQGRGVPRDLALARRYLAQAAQAGDASAQRNLEIVQHW